LKDTGNVAISARELVAESKSTDEMRDEAAVLLSRSYYYADDMAKAFESYAPLMSSSNGDFMGEAGYRRAYIKYAQNDLDAAEHIVEDIVNNPGSDYWLAKTFILWADIFHRRGNDVQAKQTLQSIIDNYEVGNDADEEVVMEARQHLQSLEQPKQETETGNNEGETPTINLDEE
jgi:hypothetical protein